MNAAVSVSERIHWIGALDPDMRTFDVILKTPSGTTYNSYCVRGSEGVAIIDTVKLECADQFFARLQQFADYDEIRAIVLNHLEPDHSGCLPELLKRAPRAKLYVSESAQLVLKALVKQDGLAYVPVTTGDSVTLGDRTLRFLHTPYLHWPDTRRIHLAPPTATPWKHLEYALHGGGEAVWQVFCRNPNAGEAHNIERLPGFLAGLPSHLEFWWS